MSLTVGQVASLFRSLECDHSQMKECHPGCGHYSCPCGIFWDDGFDGFDSQISSDDDGVFVPALPAPVTYVSKNYKSAK
jgi:hypothetical protein